MVRDTLVWIFLSKLFLVSHDKVSKLENAAFKVQESHELSQETWLNWSTTIAAFFHLSLLAPPAYVAPRLPILPRLWPPPPPVTATTAALAPLPGLRSLLLRILFFFVTVTSVGVMQSLSTDTY